jgi:hypothetical protein
MNQTLLLAIFFSPFMLAAGPVETTEATEESLGPVCGNVT